MSQTNIESRSRHWEIKLMQSAGIAPDLIPQVAYILAQDDFYGTAARTPAQIEFMGRAVDSRQLSR